MTSSQRRKFLWSTASAAEPFSYGSLRATVGPMLLPAPCTAALQVEPCKRATHSAGENRLANCFPSSPLQNQLSFQPPPPGPEGHVTYMVPLLSSACCLSLHCFPSTSASLPSTPVPPAPSLCQLTKMERWQLLKCPVGWKRTRKQGLRVCL